MIKKSLCAGALTLALVTPGCMGPNNALDSINNWNATVTKYNWLNEVIFVVIAPVHVFAWTADVLIFNTIEYWGGGNPVSDPGEFPDSFSN